MRVLKHHTDALAAQARSRRFIQRSQVALKDEDLARRRVIQPDQDIQQGRFA